MNFSTQQLFGRPSFQISMKAFIREQTGERANDGNPDIDALTKALVKAIKNSEEYPDEGTIRSICEKHLGTKSGKKKVKSKDAVPKAVLVLNLEKIQSENVPLVIILNCPPGSARILPFSSDVKAYLEKNDRFSPNVSKYGEGYVFAMYDKKDSEDERKEANEESKSFLKKFAGKYDGSLLFSSFTSMKKQGWLVESNESPVIAEKPKKAPKTPKKNVPSSDNEKDLEVERSSVPKSKKSNFDDLEITPPAFEPIAKSYPTIVNPNLDAVGIKDGKNIILVVKEEGELTKFLGNPKTVAKFGLEKKSELVYTVSTEEKARALVLDVFGEQCEYETAFNTKASFLKTGSIKY